MSSERVQDGTTCSSSFSVAVHRDDFLETPGPDRKDNLVVVFLNWNLPVCTPITWSQARARICADGGANRLYDELPNFFPDEPADEVRQRYVPDVIIGDLDSVRPEVRAFYEARRTEVIDLGHDQESTDLSKSLKLVQERVASCSSASSQHFRSLWGVSEEPFVVALGAIGGRLDHTLGNMCVLHHYPTLNVALVGEGNVTRLLRRGHHRLELSNDRVGSHCGLIPLAGDVQVSTKGLRWNLVGGRTLSMLGLISSCNVADSDVIEVETSGPLVWTVATEAAKTRHRNSLGPSRPSSPGTSAPHAEAI